MKAFNFLLAMIFAFLQGCAMISGNLVREVSALDMPERFKPRNVDDIVKKYLVEGTPKDKAKEILTSEGFKVIEQERTLDGCIDCESTIVVGRYNHRPLLSPIYDYAVVVEVGFRSGNVATVQGWYVKSAY